MENEQLIRMCAHCQQEHGLDTKGLKVSHGICNRHAIEMMKSYGMDGAARDFAAKYSGNDVLDLSNTENLMKKKAELDAVRQKTG